jgi:hypothetical protein
MEKSKWIQSFSDDLRQMYMCIMSILMLIKVALVYPGNVGKNDKTGTYLKGQ